MPSMRELKLKSRSAVVFAAVTAAALVMGGAAGSGIYVVAVTPTSAHTGQTIHVRMSAGMRLWEPIPLYIVPSDQALRPHECHANGLCEPNVAGPSARSD